MASRRDELNAYTFAKRRMLAAFVQPSATGSEEDAPRPLRNVVPSVIIAVVILAAFGAWGMLKPTAPQGWDTPGEKVIIASKSTTRYVVLKTDGKAQLHPVLNMASAKLLLDPDKGEVVKVDESVLDSGKIPHGVTIGIPYAPDRLPDPSDAGAAKHWAVCQRPGGENGNIQKAVFVFAKRDWGRTGGAGALKGGQLLYVQSAADKTRYLVDAGGTAYPLDNDAKLLQAVVPGGSEPEQVSADWLGTLHKGDKIAFPKISGVNQPAGVSGGLDASLNRVGMVLKGTQGGVPRFYVVLPGGVAPVSPFMETLLINDPDLVPLGQNGTANPVSVGSFTAGAEFESHLKWPQQGPHQVNSASTANGAPNTVCNVLRSVSGSAHTTLSTWVGSAFPAALPTGSSSAYVTPGSGQLYRQFTGSGTKTGDYFLVTDTGLRYVLQSNADRSASKACGIGGSGSTQQAQQQAQDAQIRLGYKDVQPAPIPTVWSDFLPTGPRLSSADACQPQGS
jgi:type VII secretion protein EccB